MYLIFDTETTGLPKDDNRPLTDSDNWPRMVQIAWQLHDIEGYLIEAKSYVITPEGYEIPYNAAKVHGITTEKAHELGVKLEFALEEFSSAVAKTVVVAGHNILFDLNVVGAEYYRKGIEPEIIKLDYIDTKESSTDFCALPGGKGGKFKWPTLMELYNKLFDESFNLAHNAAADVEATTRCFFELVRIGVVPAQKVKMTNLDYENFKKLHPTEIQPIGLAILDFDEVEIEEAEPEIEQVEETPISTEQPNKDASFAHLHLHTQYSILDGMTEISALADRALLYGMTAVAITDHGNMFGAKEFHKIISKKGLKPIIGMEAYIAPRTVADREKIDSKNYHLVLLAKNAEGYKNLMKLASLSYDGYYYKPRIDKPTLKENSNGLVALSACLAGEVPKKLMESGKAEGEKALLEYLDIFGEDFYIEIQRHPAEDPDMDHEVFSDQSHVNPILIELAKKHGVKVVATNDVHFLNKEDYQAHDRLICINTGKDYDDKNRMRYTGQEWFKSEDEMRQLFQDFPEAVENTAEVVAKIENYKLESDPIMPDFALPEGFDSEDKYLEHITFEGAKTRWPEITPEIRERLEFELKTINGMKFPGYFLIVWDFLKAAREMGVIVGPGRGSAAGSAVAYCLKITDIDPLKYNLLFERFLNPERISMPDIDIDFDDEGRDKILQWVKDKYGNKRVAHIITFGSMAAKSSIRDVARIHQMQLKDADYLAKMVPEKPGTTLKKAFEEVAELKKELTDGSFETKSVLENALKLEGSIRNVGTHACGIIIGKDNLENYVPLSTVKDSILDYATQYDGSHVESIGLLKMDFLGLKTLTIIKDTLRNIKISKGIDLDIDNISLEDKLTFDLYSRGETSGLFQFESDGMKNYLKKLKPNKIEDLIAMNALYRPGPMDYIDSFIARKHGHEPITYDVPQMEEYLAETYGITVYQEQVMLLSRKLANFTPGQSDSLRKAMGKKIKAMMDDLKALFVKGCTENGISEATINKIWNDWEAFSNYAFNKSHATCYTYVSYQTAYLKAHYPAEFMAAVLSHNLSDIKKLNFYLNESNKLNIKVLGPNINESYSQFTVNKNGEIRFGMGGIKGVGEAAVEAIISERVEKGPFTSVFDFVKRVNLRTVNKKTFESLAMVGSFDELGSHRAMFFATDDDSEMPFFEKIMKFGAKYQESLNANQFSLFGDANSVEVEDPKLPVCRPWGQIKQLKLEKDLMGFYLSGHPLDEYSDAINNFAKHTVGEVINMLQQKPGRVVVFAGTTSDAAHRESKNGKPFGSLAIEDYRDKISFSLFAENYLKFKHFIEDENFLFIEASIKQSFRNPNENELKIENIMLLDDVIDTYTKTVKVQVNLEEFDEATSTIFNNAVKAFKGKANLKLVFKYKDSIINMKSNNFKVEAKAFLKNIKNLKGVKYKLE